MPKQEKKLSKEEKHIKRLKESVRLLELDVLRLKGCLSVSNAQEKAYRQDIKILQEVATDRRATIELILRVLTGQSKQTQSTFNF